MNTTSNVIAAFLAALLVTAAVPGEAQPAVKQVLVLQSIDRGNLTLDHFTGEFRVGLDQRFGQPVNVVQVVVDGTGFVRAPEQAVVDYIRAMYVDRPPPDLIVSLAGPAALFVRKHRQELFPGTPLLFGSVDHRYLRNAPLGENESAVTVANDFPRLVDDILQVLPETRQVFVVIGAGAVGQFWRRELEAAFARFRGRLDFTWSDELSHEDLLRHCASLPDNSAIVYITFGTDARGGAYADEQVLADLHAKANAPLFAAFTPMFGRGIVGGSMLSIGDLARTTADVAGQILDGVPAGSLRVAPQAPDRPVFDWRELQRWAIPERRLPLGSRVEFRRPTVWDEYASLVLIAAGALVLQSLLIAWLLHERRARRRAEIDSRRNLTLAADANRRETIATLATSIGHELGQPLSAIVHSAQALRMMIAADRAGAGATAEILAEIQTEAVLATQIIERHRAMLRSHELDKRPIDLRSVVDESLALLANEARSRQIEVVLALTSTPCVIEADPVLMTQVLVNLVRNAMDALAGVPPARRRITIRTAVTAAGAELSVCDTGPGLPAEIADTLFTPFVTTKPQGLGIGLAIAQRLIDAHGGTIVAQGNTDAGATFIVTLPLHATGRLASTSPGRGKEAT